MASASSVRAGEAYVEIRAKTDQLRADLKKIPSELSSISKMFSGLGSMIASPIGLATAAITGVAMAVRQSVNEFMDMGGVLADMNARTGVGADRLQVLGFAAKQTGASLDDVEKALRAMAKNGLNVNQFEALGQKIAAMEDPTQRAAAAMEAFGKSGTKLIPMFSEFQKLKAASAALGPILTNDEIARADKLGDSFSAAAEAWSRARSQVGDAVSPLFQALAEMKAGAGIGAAELVQGNKPGGEANLDRWFGGASPWGMLRNVGKSAIEKAATAKTAEDESLASETAMADKSKRVSEHILAVQKQVSAEYAKRNALIRESLTPHEQFLEKEKELLGAIKSSVATGLGGLMNPEMIRKQVAGLHEALARLRAEESERMAAAMPKSLKDMASDGSASIAAEVERVVSSKGTFSAAGAALLGRGGDSTERKIDETNKILRRIDDGVRKVIRPAFS
jgi:hypothetical protein